MKKVTDYTFNAQLYIDGSLSSRDSSIASIDTNKIETAANIGSGDASVFSGKSGTNLQFKTIIGSGAATITDGIDTITVGLDASFAGEVNTASNLGSGSGLFSNKVGDDLQFKSLKLLIIL